MSGLRKAKKYDWKDSNMALFGSDTEKNVKKSSAETEKAWSGSGNEVGLQIWRIEKFQVKHWPKEDYGKFFSGDSYIVLNTYKTEGEDDLKYDVHFWIGEHSSQDEYGTAAYKTVELDTLLDDKPVQHREVQDHESKMFKSYFETMTIMKGGCDTGFRHVTPEEYKPRLLHFCRVGRKVTINEVSFKESSLNSGDVFILDHGEAIYQWNGKECNKDEKFQASIYCQNLESQRRGKVKASVFDEGDSGAQKVIDLLANNPDDDDDDKDSYEAADKEMELHRLTDRSGDMKMELEQKGEINKSHLDTNDVFILDGKSYLFVWIGANTSPSEKKNAMTYAHNYLMKSDHPLVSITCVKEGAESAEFNNAIAA